MDANRKAFEEWFTSCAYDKDYDPKPEMYSAWQAALDYARGRQAAIIEQAVANKRLSNRVEANGFRWLAEDEVYELLNGKGQRHD